MSSTMAVGHVFILLQIIFSLVLQSSGLMSDYKTCGDDACARLMCRVQAVRDHRAQDCRFLSFKKGDMVDVYHKLTGRRGDLWAGSMDKQFGYFLRDAVKMDEVFVDEKKEIKMKTQETDFFCMDAFGTIISSDETFEDYELGDQTGETEELGNSDFDDRVSKTSETNDNVEPKHINNDNKDKGKPEQSGSSWIGSVSGWFANDADAAGNGDKEQENFKSRKLALDLDQLEEEETESGGLSWSGDTENKEDLSNEQSSYLLGVKSVLGFGGEDTPPSETKKPSRPEQQETVSLDAKDDLTKMITDDEKLKDMKDAGWYDNVYGRITNLYGAPSDQSEASGDKHEESLSDQVLDRDTESETHQDGEGWYGSVYNRFTGLYGDTPNGNDAPDKSDVIDNSRGELNQDEKLEHDGDHTAEKMKENSNAGWYDSVYSRINNIYRDMPEENHVPEAMKDAERQTQSENTKDMVSPSIFSMDGLSSVIDGLRSPSKGAESDDEATLSESVSSESRLTDQSDSIRFKSDDDDTEDSGLTENTDYLTDTDQSQGTSQSIFSVDRLSMMIDGLKLPFKPNDAGDKEEKDGEKTSDAGKEGQSGDKSDNSDELSVRSTGVISEILTQEAVFGIKEEEEEEEETVGEVNIAETQVNTIEHSSDRNNQDVGGDDENISTGISTSSNDIRVDLEEVSHQSGQNKNIKSKLNPDQTLTGKPGRTELPEHASETSQSHKGDLYGFDKTLPEKHQVPDIPGEEDPRSEGKTRSDSSLLFQTENNSEPEDEYDQDEDEAAGVLPETEKADMKERSSKMVQTIHMAPTSEKCSVDITQMEYGEKQSGNATQILYGEERVNVTVMEYDEKREGGDVTLVESVEEKEEEEEGLGVAQMETDEEKNGVDTTQIGSGEVKDRVDTTQMESGREQGRVDTTQMGSGEEKNRVDTTQMESGGEKVRKDTAQLGSGGEKDKVDTAQMESGGEKDRVDTTQMGSGVEKDRVDTTQMESGGEKDRVDTTQMESGGEKDREDTAQLGSGGEKNSVDTTQMRSGGEKDKVDTTQMESGGEKDRVDTTQLGSGGENDRVDTTQLESGGEKDRVDTIQMESGGEKVRKDTAQLGSGGEKDREDATQMESGGEKDKVDTAQLGSGGEKDREDATQMESGGEKDKVDTTQMGSGEEKNRVDTTQMESGEEKDRKDTAQLESGGEKDRVDTTQMGSGVENDRVDTTQMESGGEKDRVDTTQMESGGEKDREDTAQLESGGEKNSLYTTQMRSGGEKDKVDTTQMESGGEKDRVDTTQIGSGGEKDRVDTTQLGSGGENDRVDTTQLESGGENDRVDTTQLESGGEKDRVDTTQLESGGEKDRVDTTQLGSGGEKDRVDTTQMESGGENKSIYIAQVEYARVKDKIGSAQMESGGENGSIDITQIEYVRLRGGVDSNQMKSFGGNDGVETSQIRSAKGKNGVDTIQMESGEEKESLDLTQVESGGEKERLDHTQVESGGEKESLDLTQVESGGEKGGDIVQVESGGEKEGLDIILKEQLSLHTAHHLENSHSLAETKHKLEIDHDDSKESEIPEGGVEKQAKITPKNQQHKTASPDRSETEISSRSDEDLNDHVSKNNGDQMMDVKHHKALTSSQIQKHTYLNLQAHLKEEDIEDLLKFFGGQTVSWLNLIMGHSEYINNEELAELHDFGQTLEHLLKTRNEESKPSLQTIHTVSAMLRKKFMPVIADGSVDKSSDPSQTECVSETCVSTTENTPITEQDMGQDNNMDDIMEDSFSVKDSGGSISQSVSNDQEVMSGILDHGDTLESDQKPDPQLDTNIISEELLEPEQSLHGVVHLYTAVVVEFTSGVLTYVVKESTRVKHALCEVVMSLPDDLRPGPDLYGLPWEAVIFTATLGLLTLLIFTCRFVQAIKSRLYCSKERKMGQKVAELLEEKCKVLETLSECEHKFKKLETALQNGGRSAQDSERDDLEAMSKKLKEANAQMKSDMEKMQEELDTQEQLRKQQEEQLTKLEEMLKKLEQEATDRQSQLEQDKTTLKIHQMNSERLEKKLQEAKEENSMLQESRAQLEQEAEGWKERLSELEEEKRMSETSHNGMMENCVNKDERIKSLTECLLKMRDWDSEEENSVNDTSGLENKTSSDFKQKQKVQKLINAAKMSADLKAMEEDKDRVFAKLKDEIKAKEDLQVGLEQLQHEKESLESESTMYTGEIEKLQHKLQIMSEMYQEKELKLHRMLTVEEKERSQKEEQLSKAGKKISQATDELNSFRQRSKELEEELEKTNQAYRNQISAHEKKAHDNWLAARAADRDLADVKRENSVLRQRLTDWQFKLELMEKNPHSRAPQFRGERSPFGPSPLGRPPSETRPFLSPPTLLDGPPRVSPQFPMMPGGRAPPGGVEGDRSVSYSESGSPTWERERERERERRSLGPPAGPDPGLVYRRPLSAPFLRAPLPPEAYFNEKLDLSSGGEGAGFRENGIRDNGRLMPGADIRAGPLPPPPFPPLDPRDPHFPRRGFRPGFFPPPLTMRGPPPPLPPGVLPRMPLPPHMAFPPMRPPTDHSSPEPPSRPSPPGSEQPSEQPPSGHDVI